MKRTRTITLQVTYRRGEPFAAYIDLNGEPRGRTVRTEEVTPELLIDYSADGEPVGIEIVTPQAVSLDEIFAAFDRLGLPRPAESELRPLHLA